jgi:hypothetical protein
MNIEAHRRLLFIIIIYIYIFFFLLPSTTNMTWTVLHCCPLNISRIQPFKSQVSAGFAVWFSLNALCSTVFSLSGKKDVQ